MHHSQGTTHHRHACSFNEIMRVIHVNLLETTIQKQRRDSSYTAGNLPIFAHSNTWGMFKYCHVEHHTWRGVGYVMDRNANG
mmetsp:Transcript_57978/g.95205  ORF Transcript_57978/g.95205 Transcript_57978/m.95205 type:complete len:82 (-) Transcript_57978:1190-1435(-)